MSEVLVKELGDQMGKKIIAITTDGGAYYGKLVSFDERFIVLDECLESTTATSLLWHQVMIEDPAKATKSLEDPLDDGKVKEKHLKKVIISSSAIVRIWPL